MASTTKHVKINEDNLHEDTDEDMDMSYDKRENYSTDEEELEEEIEEEFEEDDSEYQMNQNEEDEPKTTNLAPGVEPASSFWKIPDFPEKYPLDHLNVENLVNMLSKIHLVWPEDLPHYDDLEFSLDPDRADFPRSYYKNTDKEKVVLWHAENFRLQFINKFPNRRPPVMAPVNECGCQKLFPTYINPTASGYPEFLDCMTTVTFLKDFFSPSLLSPPTKFPERIMSHTTAIRMRKTNAFEMAIIIVSLLKGSGYDAYVVDGFASKTICTIDTTEDYPEPEETSILDYEVDREKEMQEKKENEFGHGVLSFEPSYSYLLDKVEETPLVPVSPSKYRFKVKGMDYNNPMEVTQGLDDLFESQPSSTVGTSILLQKSSSKSKTNVDSETMAIMDALDAEGEATDWGEEVTEMANDDESEDEQEDENSGKEGEGEQRGEEEKVEEHEHDDEEEEMEEEIFEEPPSSGKSKDRYHGTRTHAWVLVLPGSREIDEAFFLEPFSGTSRPLKDPHFLSVEAVFNEKNYWINIQPPMKNLKLMNWDLDNPSAWSKFLVESDRRKKKGKESDGGGSVFQDDEEDHSAFKPGDLFLTMPVSWTAEMEISQEDYDRKYPDGSKTIEYKDAIVEVAAPYANPDGMVRKVLKFSGSSRDPEDLEYIEEWFEHRKDKLTKRKWHREGKVLHEYFAPGRKDALKKHVHVSGRNKPDYPRDLFYYANAHPRGVSHRKIIKKGLIEHFEGRDDLLYHKTTLYGGILRDTIPTKVEINRGTMGEIMDLVKGIGGVVSNRKFARRTVIKIVEKYHRNEEKDAKDDISEKHMLIENARLRIFFHYQQGNLTRNSLEFFKPGHSKHIQPEFKPEDCIEYYADRSEPPMDIYKKYILLRQMGRDEGSSNIFSRESEDEIYQTVTSRIHEDWLHEIEPDAFAGVQNEAYLKLMREQQSRSDETVEEEVDLSETDFTTPFFEKYGIPKNKREEIHMKKRIMLHEKVKIMRRAYMIKELYDKEATALRGKQDWYVRHADQMNFDQEQDFIDMYKERLFHLHVLEKRMVRHQDETPRLYYNLLVQLLRHPQLNRFTNKNKAPPPPPAGNALTKEEKTRIINELSKLKDCCQFFNVRFNEKKYKIKKRQEKLEAKAKQLEEERKAKCARMNRKDSHTSRRSSEEKEISNL